MQAPRANRFILHSDDTNGKLLALEDFHSATASDKPLADVVVIAGVHLLQEQTVDFRTERLADVRRAMVSVPVGQAVHLEYASIGDKAFVADVAHSLLTAVNSLGCNEQELVCIVLFIYLFMFTRGWLIF